MKASTNSAALFCLVILIAIPPIFVEGKGKDAATESKLTATDVHGVQRVCPVDKQPGWLADAVSRSTVQYPELGVSHRQQGTGVFRMIVDPTSGRVTKVSTVRSTGFRDLDDSAITALGRWRWKPGTWKETDVAINFKLGQGSGGSAQVGRKDPSLSAPPLQGSMSMSRGGGSR